MSFKNENLSVLAYSNGFTLWSYQTEDAQADVTAANYFNDVADLVRKGDVIFSSASMAGTLEASVLSVSDVASAVVTITSM